MYSHYAITQKQAQVLEFLREFRRQEGVAPTYREIARYFGFKSIKAASDHVRALERKGYVHIRRNRSRGIALDRSDTALIHDAISIPIMGDIPAGRPEYKRENRRSTIAVDQKILDNCTGHRLFALRVTGDSMIGRSICEGDWIVADADTSPKIGDVVVALIDGENTLKTLARQRGRFFLKSENPDHPDWVPMTEMIIQGIVKAVIRRV
jgi:repressor LexA